MKRWLIGGVAASLLALSPLAAPAQGTPAAGGDKWFAVEIRVGPAWQADKPPQAQAHFRDHSQHLAKLRSEGLIVAGARYGEKGLLVLKAASIDAVRARIEEDPSMKAGTFVYELHEMRVFYPGAIGEAAK